MGSVSKLPGLLRLIRVCHRNMNMATGSFATQRSFTVAVEGNIGSGKTTLLKHFSSFPGVCVFQEPVDKWRNVQGHNLLDLLYQDPKRWSLTFQTYVQLTMTDIHMKTIEGKVNLMERSVFSARYCFVENLYRSGMMPDAEYTVLSQWFSWLVNHLKISVDLIVYLRTRPEVVFDRIMARSRREERQIPLNYLESLHELHESWLLKKTNNFQLLTPVLVVDGNKNHVDMQTVYHDIENDILGTNGHRNSSDITFH